MSEDILAFEPLIAAWRRDGAGPAAALQWTASQVAAFARLVADDAGWERLLAIFERGRAADSWLATDWPSGFDELLLCAPLCQLVQFECARCTIGERQGSLSCAHPGTVFGRIGELLRQRDRLLLLRHLESAAAMLDPSAALQWDPVAATLRPAGIGAAGPPPTDGAR
jgi:hypothetical protein